MSATVLFVGGPFDGENRQVENAYHHLEVADPMPPIRADEGDALAAVSFSRSWYEPTPLHMLGTTVLLMLHSSIVTTGNRDSRSTRNRILSLVLSDAAKAAVL